MKLHQFAQNMAPGDESEHDNRVFRVLHLFSPVVRVKLVMFCEASPRLASLKCFLQILNDVFDSNLDRLERVVLINQPHS